MWRTGKSARRAAIWQAVQNPKHIALPSKQKSNSRKPFLLPLLLLMLGLGVILYPLVATQLGNWERVKIAREYTQRAAQIDHSTLDDIIESARAYNQRNAGAPILDPWLARVSQDNAKYQEYLAELAILPQMGRLTIPRIKVDIPIFHGTDAETLERAVGHLYGSDLPIGDPTSHTVLTAHSGLSHATLFDNLHELEKGDHFYLDVAGQKMKYEVRQIQTVLPEEVSFLKQYPNQDLVTLITCTPYGVNSHRLLVTGERVPIPAAEVAHEMKDTTFADYFIWQWWMNIIVLIVLLVLSLFIYWLTKLRKEEREEKNSPTD